MIWPVSCTRPSSLPMSRYGSANESKAGSSDPVPGVSPGPSRRALAAYDLGFAGVPCGGGAVRVQHDRPAPPVDDNLVVERAEQDAVLDAGLAAVGLLGDVVYFARRRGLVTAPGPLAVLITQE